MKNALELNCLELEAISAGEPKVNPNGSPTMRDRVVSMKKAFGLPESLWGVGLPKLLP